MSHNRTRRNFYEILNATSTASLNELKSNYKQLILQFHPDKLQQHLDLETNHSQKNDEPHNFEFVAITEAWNCLKDPNKRKQYDAEQLLNKFHTHNNIYAHIKLSEMKKQPNTAAAEYYDEEVEKLELKKCEEMEELKYIYTYDCRCGGQYIVDESAEQYCRAGNNHETPQINDNNGVDHDDDNDDDANNKGSPSNIKCKNNGSEGVVHDNNDDDDDDDVIDEEDGGDLIVECSECSLVIILNG